MSASQVSPSMLRAAPSPDLALCEGFRVESPDGYVGVVEALRYTPSSRWDRPSGLVVQAGRSSEMLLIVPLAEIECVYLTERRVVLRPSPEIAATERASANGRDQRWGEANA
jgi:hypothetical protein